MTKKKIATGGPLIARTHRFTGLFPMSLFISGMGDSEPIKERSFEVTTDDGRGNPVKKQLVMRTDSALGLPCQRDPLVFLGLLKMLFDKGAESNAVSFRKQELLDLLGWDNTKDEKRAVEIALKRYFAAEYRGVNLWAGKSTEQRAERNRRLIISIDIIDERKVRFAAQRVGDEEAENLYTRVEFHPDLCNEIRENPLGIDFNLLRQLSSPLARRLFEVLNLWADTAGREFDFDVRELAHERLGISRTRTSPGQCWEKIAPAFKTLKDGGYLEEYEYAKPETRVRGTINEKHVAPHLPPLPPLPAVTDRRELLIARARLLGTNANVARRFLMSAGDKHLDKIEFVINYIKTVKDSNADASFNYGGWVVKEIKYIIQNDQINQSLLRLLDEDTPLPSDEGLASDGPAAEEAEPPDPDPEAAEVWGEIAGRLSERMQPQSFETWIRPLVPVRAEESAVFLQCPNAVVCEWVASSYEGTVSAVLAAHEFRGRSWRVILLGPDGKEAASFGGAGGS